MSAPDLSYGLGCPSCRHYVVVSEEDPDGSLSDLYDHVYWTHAPSDNAKANQLMARAVELTRSEAVSR